ncbi:antibiotic biosynthesis monooxygenase [Nocardia sp. NPDC006630]|uniref:antibiotic biosynthesis monooxygenase n=1 Tax=unclassified Nocardia TaxID=2637762 RepID=UPI00324EF79E
MTAAIVVQYRTRADSAAHNQRLAERVVEELNARDPGGLRYQVFRLEDGVGFVHIAVFDGTADPFGDSCAFAAFHAEFPARLVGPATVLRAAVVGTYGIE